MVSRISCLTHKSEQPAIAGGLSRQLEPGGFVRRLVGSTSSAALSGGFVGSTSSAACQAAWSAAFSFPSPISLLRFSHAVPVRWLFYVYFYYLFFSLMGSALVHWLVLS